MKTTKEIILRMFEEHGIMSIKDIDVNPYYDEAIENHNSNMTLKSFKQYCNHVRQQLELEKIYYEDDQHKLDTPKHNIKLHRENQRLKDLRRIENNDLRNKERYENALIELNTELINLLQKNDLSKFTKLHDVKSNSANYGVIHLTDLHFNELIDSVSIDNKYDFTIASKRLHKLAQQAKKLFNAYNIKTIVLADTGDFLNSDRRLDEKLSMATNRTQATLLACYLLEQFILDLNKSFNVNITYVVGNESRVNEDYGFSEIIASDSYDTMIHSILKIMFKNCKGIKFLDSGPIETVVSLGQDNDVFNILLLHGDKISHTNLERSIYSKIAKYSHKKIVIDYVLFGHLHETRIADYYARGASLAGGNAYSEEGLNLISKASQNIFIIQPKTKDIIGCKIDLQNVDDIQGYSVINALEAYNAKSVTKLNEITPLITKVF